MEEHVKPVDNFGTKTRAQNATIGDVEDSVKWHLRELQRNPASDAADASRDDAIMELAKSINELSEKVNRSIEVAKQIDELAEKVAALAGVRADDDAELSRTTRRSR